VIDQLRAEQPNETQTLALFGVSLGAAVVLATSVMRDDVSAVVLECPFADYRHAVSNHSKIMGMPLRTLQPLAIRTAEWISHADFNQVRPIDLIAKCPAPLLIFQACNDPFVGEDVRLIEDAMTKREQSGLPSKFIAIPEAGHVMGICCDPDSYREQLRAFLEQNIASAMTLS